MSAPAANAPAKKQRSKKKKHNKPKHKKQEPKEKSVAVLPNKAPETNSFTNRRWNQQALANTRSYYKLTDEEYKIAFAWLMNMLDPKKAFKFPRPIPALSYADVKSGEIIWETSAEYTEVRIRPDPFQTVMIRQLGVNASVDITGDTNFGEDFRTYGSHDPEEQWIANTTHRVTTQISLPLNNGTYLAPIRKNVHVSGAGGGFVNNQYDAGAAYCYSGLVKKGNTPISAYVTNRSNIQTSVQPSWTIRNADGTIASATTGATVLINTGARSLVTWPDPTSLNNPLPEQLLSIDFLFTQTSIVDINSFAFEFHTMSLDVISPISTEFWTLGQAAYGKSSSDAILLDNILSTCQLFAPCGMSALWNIDQQLNTAGGRFQASYLPTRIDPQLPGNFGEQWTFIKSRSVSYPVAETPFVKGAQGSWVGARIFDYEFKRPLISKEWQNLELETLPQVHFLQKKVADAATITLRLSFNFAYEMQTTHPAYTMTMGFYHAELAGLTATILAAHSLLVGENPSHVARLKTLTKQALTNPLLQKAFKEAISLGLSLL